MLTRRPLFFPPLLLKVPLFFGPRSHQSEFRRGFPVRLLISFSNTLGALSVLYPPVRSQERLRPGVLCHACKSHHGLHQISPMVFFYSGRVVFSFVISGFFLEACPPKPRSVVTQPPISLSVSIFFLCAFTFSTSMNVFDFSCWARTPPQPQPPQHPPPPSPPPPTPPPPDPPPHNPQRISDGNFKRSLPPSFSKLIRL